jgi:hypothetical protein
MKGSVRINCRCVGADPVDGNIEDLAAVFKRDLHCRWIDSENASYESFTSYFANQFS